VSWWSPAWLRLVAAAAAQVFHSVDRELPQPANMRVSSTKRESARGEEKSESRQEKKMTAAVFVMRVWSGSKHSLFQLYQRRVMRWLKSPESQA
jgi:hypothetical protein